MPRTASPVLAGLDNAGVKLLHANFSSLWKLLSTFSKSQNGSLSDSENWTYQQICVMVV